VILVEGILQSKSSGHFICSCVLVFALWQIPGGELSDSRVINGVMFNKDVTHSKMRRRIENPRILLLDCPLEYKKGESQANVEIQQEEVGKLRLY